MLGPAFLLDGLHSDGRWRALVLALTRMLDLLKWRVEGISAPETAAFRGRLIGMRLKVKRKSQA